MALISCPQCGKKISDKAVKCPHCKIDVQKVVLAEVREEERQRQEKHRRRTFILVVSVLVVVAFTVLAYLYNNDALSSIPAEYRKQTEGYFNSYEINIDKGDFERANGYLNTLKDRRLTNRQAKRLKEKEKDIIEKGLRAVENTIDKQFPIANNSDAIMDDGLIGRLKEEMASLSTFQLGASQTERLQKAKEKYVEFQLEEMEKRVKSHESDTKGFYSYYTTEQLALDLQGMELSTAQKTRLEKLNKDIDRLKNQREEERHKQLLKTIRDEYIGRLNDHKSYDSDYDEYDGYFLYDIDNDGIPEIWIKSGGYSTGNLYVYTYNNGIRMLYSDGAGHSDYYQGYGYIIEFYGQMGYATWKKLTYNGSSITSTIIYEEDINGTNRDYREPEEKHINLYSLNNKQPILNAFKSDPSNKKKQEIATPLKDGKETFQTNYKESKVITEEVRIDKNEEELPDEDEIYQIVDEMPSFPGGEQKLMEYISQNIQYPQVAREKGIQGRVFVGFIVEPDGSISDVKILRGIGGGCDEEAMRIMNASPKWKPGKLRGKVVRVSYQIPMFFKLP